MDKITPVSLLITGIVTLAGAIAPLVIYIKSLVTYISKLHKAHEERVSILNKTHEERLINLYKENLIMISKVIETINKNSEAINRNTDVTQQNNITVNDFHKYILSQKNK